MSILAPVLKHRFLDQSGRPLSGGKLYSYIAGTNTPKATFVDKNETSNNTNPIILDANGECDLWITSGYYKFILKDSNDVQRWSVDQVAGGVTVTGIGTYDSLTVQNELVVSNLAADKVVLSDIDKKLISSVVTNVELDKLSGIGSKVDGISDANTLTNKTIVSPVITTPTGIVKADVGLSNVDNTSDATKNAATATLTNKTLTSPIINTPDLNCGAASNTSRIILPKNTKTNLDALTRVQASLVYDTVSNKPFIDNGTTLTPLGGGGGAGSLVWRAMAQDGALEDIEFERNVFKFPLNSGITCELKLPKTHIAGTHKKIALGVYTPTTGVQFKLKLTSKLIVNGANLSINPSHTKIVSYQPSLTVTNYQYMIIDFDLTESDGTIDATAVSPDASLFINLERIAASANEESDMVRIIPTLTEVYDV